MKNACLPYFVLPWNFLEYFCNSLIEFDISAEFCNCRYHKCLLIFVLKRTQFFSHISTVCKLWSHTRSVLHPSPSSRFFVYSKKVNQVLEHYTDKKNTIFLIYMEIQMGAVVKSYMRKSFLKYEERRKYLAKYEEAVSHIWLCNGSLLDFLIFEESFDTFLSV
jgi:hypothetical protein